MTIRKPLVIGASGQIEQLQSGDSIAVPTAGASTVSLQNGEAAAVSFGMAVYAQAAGAFKKAIATAAATARVIGLVFDTTIANGANGQVAVDGILTGTTTQWDAVAGTTGGLTAGTVYFLDPTTAGMITATPPTTVGQLLTRIGVALSSTTLMLDIQAEILL